MAMPPDGATTITQRPEDLRAKVNAQVVDGKPAFFKLEAQLPQQGRTDTPLAASDKMGVVLKTYAADGENGLHAHPNEDHTFVVLQGEATFYGPNEPPWRTWPIAHPSSRRNTMHHQNLGSNT
jgi:mannose-6-phosphate isomerase-like protein (cupin superfamily)